MSPRIPRRAALALTGAALAAPALAQGVFPNRPVTLVIPYPPGGTIDILGRALAPGLEASLGQSVVIENRGGASGNIGTQRVARAAPDGYTVALTTNAPLVTNRFFMRDLGFDPDRELTPVSAGAEGLMCLVVARSLPVANVAEFLAHLRANPGRIGFGTPGVGSPHHLAGEFLKQLTNTDMTHIPYRGGAAAVTDLSGGQLPAAVLSLAPVLPARERVRILALTSNDRYATEPDIPTLRETVPGFVNGPAAMTAFVAPAGTPPAAIARWNAAVRAAFGQPSLAPILAQNGFNPIPGTPEALSERLNAERVVVERLVTALGIRPE
jgi:tripartite-type tricarboxylate transporter receptor subunit TctC